MARTVEGPPKRTEKTNKTTTQTHLAHGPGSLHHKEKDGRCDDVQMKKSELNHDGKPDTETEQIPESENANAYGPGRTLAPEPAHTPAPTTAPLEPEQESRTMAGWTGEYATKKPAQGLNGMLNMNAILDTDSVIAPNPKMGIHRQSDTYRAPQANSTGGSRGHDVTERELSIDKRDNLAAKTI